MPPERLGTVQHVDSCCGGDSFGGVYGLGFADYDPFMASADDPVVQTLSAVIRVLQVGSKSVSLSAARQLDSVDGAVIKPFGRARIEAKPADGLIEVIGSVNGVLARSSAHAKKSSVRDTTRHRGIHVATGCRGKRARCTAMLRRVGLTATTSG
jgi:hypothetical protein